MVRKWVAMALVIGLCGGCKDQGGGQSVAKWQDPKNWGQLRPGMSQDQVKNILGEPTRIEATSAFTDWVYGETKGGKVTFAGTMMKDWKSPE